MWKKCWIEKDLKEKWLKSLRVEEKWYWNNWKVKLEVKVKYAKTMFRLKFSTGSKLLEC